MQVNLPKMKLQHQQELRGALTNMGERAPPPGRHRH